MADLSDAFCNKCLFWEQTGTDEDMGVCRRYPPKLARGDGSLLDDYDLGPLTLECDWCGEFRQRDL